LFVLLRDVEDEGDYAAGPPQRPASCLRALLLGALQEILASVTNQFCHKICKNRHKTLFRTFSNNVMYFASQKVPCDNFVKISQIKTIYDVSQPS